jgi:hypothetical protein
MKTLLMSARRLAAPVFNSQFLIKKCLFADEQIDGIHCGSF